MKRGRPKKEPGVTTTVRYPVRFADFVSSINLSDFVAARLEEALIDAQAGPQARFVREARRFGLNDAQISLLLQPEPVEPAS